MPIGSCWNVKWRIWICNTEAGLGLLSLVFWANHSFFAQKWANEQFAQKNEQFAHSLIFGEQLEQFAHGLSFLVNNLSKSLMVAHLSLIFGERPERFVQIAHQKRGNKQITSFFK